MAQTRFGWDATRKRFDRDGDGQIARPEFPGTDADFARLDRDHDGALTAADFDFSPHALAPSPGAMLFYAGRPRRQRQGHPRGVRRLLHAVDSGGQGFLSLADLQEAFPPPPRPARPPSGRSGGPSKETLVRGLFRQEIGSLQPGPALGETAPDFTLKTNDGKEEVTLSKLVGPKPVVLVFGNFTCGPFRSQAGNVEKLYRRYKDRATFVMVYVREAHPTDGWRMESNDRVGVSLAQPRTYDERVEVAQTCGKTPRPGLPDARRHDRRHRRRPLQRHAQPALPDRPRGQGRLQERPRARSASSRPSWSTRWSCCSRTTTASRPDRQASKGK